MVEDALLEQIGKLIEPIRSQLYEQGANIGRLVQGQKRLEADVKVVDRKVENVDLKVALIHDQNKKDHSEMMDMLVDLGEISWKSLIKRIERIEKHLDLPHSV